MMTQKPSIRMQRFRAFNYLVLQEFRARKLWMQKR